ncbi:MAG: hypothetical protein KAI63_03755, partial [Planctomycetes bacterium]|nr:hypothetical protein [Planctomycetota bacterium]
CVDKNSQGKVVINLKRTEHIARACIKVFIPFAQSDRNFIICDPNEVVVQKLLKYGFPKSNIRVSSARQLNRAG